jgi:hypothetical protein
LLKALQNGAFFDRELCNARRFAPLWFVLVWHTWHFGLADPEQSVSITLAPLPGGDWGDS